MRDTHNTGNKEYMNKLDNIPALPGRQTIKQIYETMGGGTMGGGSKRYMGLSVHCVITVAKRWQ